LLSSVLETPAENEGEQSNMNKKKAKSGIGADFKSEMNGLLDDLNKDKK